MPKWSQWLDEDYLDNEPSKSFEPIKRGQRQTDEIKGVKKKVKPRPIPIEPPM